MQNHDAGAGILRSVRRDILSLDPKGNTIFRVRFELHPLLRHCGLFQIIIRKNHIPVGGTDSAVNFSPLGQAPCFHAVEAGIADQVLRRALQYTDAQHQPG